jgi:site-specific DNA recombinase
MIQKAVIYARVSSVKQVTEGNGLASQETRCRDYAKHKNYEIIDVFRDEGLSGKLLDRPNMKAMLSYLKKHKHEKLVVIIDDISRLARDIETHIRLRASITDAGGKLESPSIEFGEDSDSRLVEHLLASVAAHQAEKNAEQVKNRMMSRMQNGYWTFYPVPGYIYVKENGSGGKILVRDEPLASIIAEGLEGYACGRFETISELRHFFMGTPHFQRDRKGKIYFSQVRDILDRVFYAGYINKPEWGLSMVKGKHEPLISYETYRKIQDRLHGQAKAPAKLNINEDFPLRGFVICACCERPMAACWSTGRNGKYPYYLCRTNGCERDGKSIRREQVEGDFESLLADLKPSEHVFFMAAAMFTDLWNAKREAVKTDTETLRQQALLLDRKSTHFFQRIANNENPTLIGAYENQIRILEEEKIRLDEKIVQCGRPLAPFDETFRTAFSFLSNPQKIWAKGNLEHKRAVIKLTFTNKLAYDKKTGFRTAETSLPVRLLQELSLGRTEMVEGVGFEPTYSGEGRFTVCCL